MDLTLTNDLTSFNVVNWQVSEGASLSDHVPIFRWSLKTQDAMNIVTWFTDCKLFREHIRLYMEFEEQTLRIIGCPKATLPRLK